MRHWDRIEFWAHGTKFMIRCTREQSRYAHNRYEYEVTKVDGTKQKRILHSKTLVSAGRTKYMVWEGPHARWSATTLAGAKAAARQLGLCNLRGK